MEPMREEEPVTAACQGGKQMLLKTAPSYHGVAPMMGCYFWMLCLLSASAPGTGRLERNRAACAGCRGSDGGSHFSWEGSFHLAPETFHPQFTARKAPTQHKHVFSHSYST